MTSSQAYLITAALWAVAGISGLGFAELLKVSGATSSVSLYPLAFFCMAVSCLYHLYAFLHRKPLTPQP